MVAIIFPLAGLMFWAYRSSISAQYHIRVIGHNLDDESKMVDEHLLALLSLPSPDIDLAMKVTGEWSASKKKLLSEMIVNALQGRLPIITPVGKKFFSRPNRIYQTASFLRKDPRKGYFVRLALLLDPENTAALHMSAAMASLNGDAAKAAREMQKVLATEDASGPTGFSIYRDLGKLWMKLDEYAKAEKCFRKAMALNKYAPAIMQYLSDSLQRQGKYAEAIKVCTKILQHEPGNPIMLAKRAELFFLFGRPQSGEKDFAVALKLCPPNSQKQRDIEAYRTAIVARSQSRETALENFRKELRKSPGDPQVLQDMAQTMADLGSFAESINAYRELILADAGNPGHYNNLSWLLSTASDPEYRNPKEALRLARKAAEIDEYKSPYILDTLAEAYYVNRNFAQAVKWEETALRKGGKTYNSSLQRYRKALNDFEAGKEVSITECPLADHHKPLKGDRGAPLEPDTIESGPVMPPKELWRRLENRRNTTDLNELFQNLVKSWQELGPPAINDPVADMLSITQAVIGGRRNSRPTAYGATNSVMLTQRSFLIGLATSLKTGTGDKFTYKSSDINTKFHFIMGIHTGRKMSDMTRPQMRQVLNRIADGKLLIGECIGYNRKKATKSEFERLWTKISSRLELAASEKKMSAPATETVTPKKPHKKRFMPPPMEVPY